MQPVAKEMKKGFLHFFVAILKKMRTLYNSFSTTDFKNGERFNSKINKGRCMKKKQLLVWIDLEMTGLMPEKDKILEIATVLTDNDLNIVEQGPAAVIHQDDSVLTLMNDWVGKQHSKSGLIDEVKLSKISLAKAEQMTLEFLKKHCDADESPLCGNSICTDRAFMRIHMPQIVDFLHYRMIDVTAVKEIVARWYPGNPKAEYTKKDAHRALPDILESIDELRHYRKNFFK